MAKHIKIHVEEKKSRPFCICRTDIKPHSMKHTKTQTGEKNFSCSFCDYKAVTKWAKNSNFSLRPKSDVSPSMVGLKQKKKEVSASRSTSVPNRLRLTNVGDHLPMKGTSRRCAFCSTGKKSKRSQIICSGCNVALCLECYIPFHK